MDEQGNLIRPITFDEGEIDVFVRDHVCGLCLGHLNKRPVEGRKWQAECPNCGPILLHNKVTKAVAVRVEDGCRVAEVELRAMRRKPRSEAEIMRELGF